MKTLDEITFIVQCIQLLANRLCLSQEEIYVMLNRKNIIENYIVPCFSILRRQSWITIQNELLSILNEG
ncbi:DUF3791 domain-containing protein [uncultured Faecalicoccus sp.]|uniref:DUF3791 domain-containing protein n=1 Tax=uncultured Faecalicoccus sp. TaxID=1971760 RepID=UPI0026152EAA|nr:DUF3791 domain-containing protein [uncultured Faecalicoccus sp.]